MEIRLEITNGPSRGRHYTLREGEAIVVGRSSRCNLVVGGDPRCSRAHCLVFLHPPHCYVRDLGSLNGTFVNGQRVQPVAPLNHGDCVRVGDSEITVEIIAEAPAEPLAPAGAERQPDETYLPGAEPPEGTGSLPRVELSGEESEVVPPPSEGEERLQFVEDEEVGEADELEFVRSEGDQEAGGPGEGNVVRCVRCGREEPAEAVQAIEANGEAVFVCERCREQAQREEGAQIPGYRIRRHLCQGGMGHVWEAERISTRERVAIKTMLPDIASSRTGVRRFQREMRIAQQLQHPNIVRCLEADEHRGVFYIVMEFVEGTDAERARERAGGRLPVEHVVRIALQVLDALEYAHRQGVVHRDLKPANLMLVEYPHNLLVKVTDFGLALARGMSGLTRPGQALGTLPFMPPEQVLDSHRVDARADIFGLGATMYYLLTGQFVYDFQPGVREPHLTIIEDEVVPIERRRRDLPDYLVQTINRAIRKDPRRRFGSAAEMREAL